MSFAQLNYVLMEKEKMSLEDANYLVSTNGLFGIIWGPIVIYHYSFFHIPQIHSISYFHLFESYLKTTTFELTDHPQKMTIFSESGSSNMCSILAI